MADLKWIKSGSRYNQVEGEIESVPVVPPGIYETELTMAGWFLHKTADKFDFPYKLYDLQNDFLLHLKKTYECTTGNLGILFNGIRGTGKTVTAKTFANMLNLPIIIVKSMGDHNEGLISYLSSFNFDCVFFFDEFEKQFNENDCSILQFMDGVYSSNYRRVFLLTTNSLSVNENLLSRPSRVRYVREFGNLEEKVVREYLKDNLHDQEATEELVGYVDTLTISTIDILKTIVEEVNIHGIDKFLEVKKFFNVKTATFDYRMVRAYIHQSDVERAGAYTIDDFLREKESWESRYERKSEMETQAKLIKDDDERAKFISQWQKNNQRRGNFDYDYFCAEKPWDKHIVKKDYFNGELVIKVDVQKRVIVTLYNNDLYFYYIKDETKPSLYGGYAYGYQL
jgi:broad-specificity NMP kinase